MHLKTEELLRLFIEREKEKGELKIIDAGKTSFLTKRKMYKKEVSAHYVIKLLGKAV